MKLYQIYFSPTGGTQKVVHIIGSAWDCETKHIDLMDARTDFEVNKFQEEDVCIIGVPSFGGRVPGIVVRKLRRMEGNNAKAVLVCVYGNRAYEDTLLELKDTLQDAGFRCCAAVAAVAEHSIMRQYAKGRPEKEDIEVLGRFADQIRGKINTIDNTKAEELVLPGSRPYKVYKGVPLKPDTDDTCNRCGLCAKTCPVHAISFTNPFITENQTCISCMHCVSVCPNESRKLNKVLLYAAAQSIRKACSVQKENELFI